MMTADGQRAGDGSWELTIIVVDIEVERKLRVTGDLHIGGLMLKLVEDLDMAQNWSDHALWWPERNVWLARTRSTLNQCGVQADARLEFTPMHNILIVQLPDLQVKPLRVNFADCVFNVVIKLCKELQIRHPEEMSLARLLSKSDLKKNQGVSATRRTRAAPAWNSNGHHLSNNSLDSPSSPYRSPYTPTTPQGTLLRNQNNGSQSPHPYSPYGTLGGNYSPNSPNVTFNANGGVSPSSMNSLAFEGAGESLLANSPPPQPEALHTLYRPKSLAEKARINSGWLDSSRTLMEQGLRDNDTALLRFKFNVFYDLNPKYDRIRINQIYEQAKWALRSEEVECTVEESCMFAALQVQAQMQQTEPQPDLDMTQANEEDEIDAALTDLQTSLEGSSLSGPGGDLTHTPELQDYLKYYKPKKIPLKTYKRLFFVFKDTYLSLYKLKEDLNESPLARFSIKGCDVVQDVNISAQKFVIKLLVPSSDGLAENFIKCENENQFAKWMAAFKMASKGRTMADSAYETEVSTLLNLLSMQHTSKAGHVTDGLNVDIHPEEYLPPRVLKKYKSKELVSRIIDAHTNVREMTLVEAKLNYVRAWQQLREYGLHYFIIKRKGAKKEELLAIAPNRLMLLDLNTGDTLKTWRSHSIKTWSVNWEIKQVNVDFDNDCLAFQCFTADCKVVHEFIGGYMFLHMRSGDKSQTLNQEMFHKLTGGRD